MTISAKVLNDSIKEISDSNSLLDMLLEFEKTLDSLDLYAFKNWMKGEILEGPKLKRHFVNVKLMYPYKDMPDPDILIRTGNTKRLSNFLLWQLSYSEIFFVKKLWPDFNEKDYIKILKKFKKIKRNYGGI